MDYKIASLLWLETPEVCLYMLVIAILAMIVLLLQKVKTCWIVCILRGKNGSKGLIIEGDSKILIDSTLGRCATSWRFKTILQNILSYASYVDEIQFKHIFYKANFVVDVSVARGHTLNVYKFGVKLCLMKLCMLGRLTPLGGLLSWIFFVIFFFQKNKTQIIIL